MESFVNICKMTQPEVKQYMKAYLTGNQYNVIDEDGFLYAKGDVPVLLVAHMDTVHKEKCVKVDISESCHISSPQGIGGDDRCGVFIISQIVKELRCSVLLCEDEEIGGVGARKFSHTKYINDLGVNYMIEFDRKGNSDAVFYSCDNAKFEEFVIKATGFEKAFGSFSDISVLMPIAKLSAVNLSSGYFNPHTVNEYVSWNDMMDTAEIAKELIKTECDAPFEYVAKTFKIQNYPRNSYTFQDNFLDWPLHDNSNAKMAKDDTEIELEVIIPDEVLLENAIYVSGKTKADCWMAFFLDNPDICFNDIISHSWS